MRTPRGRMATRHTYLHFGLKPPARTETLPDNLELFNNDEE